MKVDADKVNEIERETQGQSDCQEWIDERKFRFTEQTGKGTVKL